MTTGRLPLSLFAVLVALVPARATPLDKDTCLKLKTEQEQLENAGVERDMEKGPAWAKANLAPEKLTQVKRFIELEEQILFRCRAKSLVTLPPDPELAQPAAKGARGGAQGGQAKADEDDDDDAADSPKAQPKQKGKPAAQTAKAAAAKPGTTVKHKAPAKTAAGQTDVVKTPPKAKVDDAFRPPPPDPSVNPFAGKLRE
jgi:hypothetical protein